MIRIQSHLILADVISSAPPINATLNNALASEIGLLLLIAAAGVMTGFLLPRVLRALRLLSLLLIGLLILAWIGGAAIDTSIIPTPIDLLSLFRPLCDLWTQHVSTSLRAGVGAVGFVLGLCLNLRAVRSA